MISIRCNDKKYDKGGRGRGIVARKRKSKRIMNRARRKSRKKGGDYTGGWKRDSDPCTRSQELWVSHIFADERLKAFHSRLYFRPVNRVPLPLSRTYETAAAPLRAKQKDGLSFLPLPLSLEKALYRFQYVRDELLCVCDARTLEIRGIFVNISPLMQWQWQANN